MGQRSPDWWIVRLLTKKRFWLGATVMCGFPVKHSGCGDVTTMGGECSRKPVATAASVASLGRRNGFPVELVGGQRCHRGVMSIQVNVGATQPANTAQEAVSCA